MAEDEILLLKFKKNEVEEIRVSELLHDGKKFIDFRLWYQDGDDWKPSRKGFVLPKRQGDEFLEQLRKL